MRATVRAGFAIAVALAISGCQASGSAPAASGAPATLYKYAGSRQCVGGGISAEDARRALEKAGVRVIEAGCGSDGRMYAATCGSGDGRIVIVKVPAGQAPAARSQGFAPLEQLPDAVPQRCR